MSTAFDRSHEAKAYSRRMEKAESEGWCALALLLQESYS